MAIRTNSVEAAVFDGRSNAGNLAQAAAKQVAREKESRIPFFNFNYDQDL
jgi:hypothetical protein